MEADGKLQGKVLAKYIEGVIGDRQQFLNDVLKAPLAAQQQVAKARD
jgi:hypothetical protein